MAERPHIYIALLIKCFIIIIKFEGIFPADDPTNMKCRIDEEKYIHAQVSIPKNTSNSSSDLLFQTMDTDKVPLKWITHEKECTTTTEELIYNFECKLWKAKFDGTMMDIDIRVWNNRTNKMIWEVDQYFDPQANRTFCSNNHQIKDLQVATATKTDLTILWIPNKWEHSQTYIITSTDSNKHKVIDTIKISCDNEVCKGTKYQLKKYKFHPDRMLHCCKYELHELSHCVVYYICVTPKDGQIDDKNTCVSAKTNCTEQVFTNKNAMRIEIKVTIGTLALLLAMSLSIIVVTKYRKQIKEKVIDNALIKPRDENDKQPSPSSEYPLNDTEIILFPCDEYYEQIEVNNECKTPHLLQQQQDTEVLNNKLEDPYTKINVSDVEQRITMSNKQEIISNEEKNKSDINDSENHDR